MKKFAISLFGFVSSIALLWYVGNVGYRLWMFGSESHFQLFLNHVDAPFFDEMFISLFISFVFSVAAISMSQSRSRRLIIGAVSFYLLNALLFFLLRRFGIIVSYEEFAAHGNKF